MQRRIEINASLLPINTVDIEMKITTAAPINPALKLGKDLSSA